jgi:hypothetical protein
MGSKSGTKRIVFSHADGNLSIDIPIEDIANDPTKLAAHEARIAADHPTWTHEGTVEDTTLPPAQAGQSRKFRNCWRWTGTAVETDLPLARAQLMAEMRKERDKRLETSDGKQLRANEIGTAQDQTDWNTHREALRDLPVSEQAAVDALTTAADLEAHTVTWPTEPA